MPKKNTKIIAYKVFNPDFTCRDFQFEIGKTYTHKGRVKACSSGFHACLKAADCFNYYGFDSNNKVALVHLSGQTDTHDEDSKIAAETIKIVKELAWHEVLDLVNTGRDNTGHRNSGDRNSGHSNSGDRNSGHSNSGDRNSGDSNSGHSNSGDSNSGHRNSGHSNSGDSNSGHRNSGDRNSGDRNSGDRNSGDRNSGDRNSGDSNSGDSNSGHRNSGHRNSGDRNSGDRNSGHRNSGHSNSGDSNSGDRNSGHRNSGHSNSGDRNSGHSNSGAFNSGNGMVRFFCSENIPVYIFNKPTDKTQDEVISLMPSFWNYDLTEWVWASAMTDEEKEKYPFYETTGGYLKTVDYKEMCQTGWAKDDDDNKLRFFNLPNFDLNIFFEITGIDATADYTRLMTA
jgi:hypothetical protein